MIGKTSEQSKRKSIKLRVFQIASAIAMLLTSSFYSSGHQAFANPPRVTAGDAQAVLHGSTTGGSVIFKHRGTVEGGPSDSRLGSLAAIRPIPPWNGRHFCADDWHVLLVTVADGGDSSYSRQDAVTALDPIQITFELDGAPLSTTRTTIRRVAATVLGVEEAYSFSQGRVMSPEELSPGPHELSLELLDPASPPVVLTIWFYVDAPGTGTCLE